MKKKFRYFFYFYRYLKYRVFVAFVLSIAVGLLDGIGLALFIPLLRLVIGNDTKTPKEDEITQLVVGNLGIEQNLVNILGLILLFFTLKGVAKYFENYIRVLYQQYFMRQIRISNLDLLDSYNFKSFVNADVGRIQNTLTAEVEKINNAFRYYFKAFQYGVLVFVYLIMAFVSDPVFSLLVGVGGVATNYIFKWLYRRTKMFSTRITTRNHLFHGMVIQRVAFFKYLKTTGINLRYSRKLKEIVYDLERLQLKLGVVDAFLAALREPLIILIVAMAIYVQVVFLSGASGMLILSLLLLYRALTFFMGMQEQWNFFLGLSGSLDNMEQFTAELSEGKESGGERSFKGFMDGLELKNVSFRYGKEKVLQGIDLTIHKNEVFAIVGESGSGKTTLMNILSGLLVPTKGSYTIDSTPVQYLDQESFKRQIGYIPQDVIIFNDSIFNNVTLWADKNPENLRKFYDALEKSSLAVFVDQLPQQEETVLGSNGINLSGGQKQRISIARELFKEVQLLLFDEATSALDSKTETAIQNNLDQLKGHFTIIVIAHRLATIKNADRILVLKNGTVQAIGDFKELLEQSKPFREMIKLQNISGKVH